MVDEELLSFIDATYREEYSLLRNNCIHKSIRIRNKARERGKQADLIWCASVVPVRKLRHFWLVSPHMYAVIDGEKVDVSLDPGHEARYCRNAEKRLLFPVNISKIWYNLRTVASHAEACLKLRSDGK